MLTGILFGALAFAGLIFHAWAEGLWFWRRPEKGLIDLEVAPDVVATKHITTDIKYIEGKQQ